METAWVATDVDVVGAAGPVPTAPLLQPDMSNKQISDKLANKMVKLALFM